MYTFISSIHILVCVCLVITVLLQSGKGGGLAGAFGGGGTQAVFGGRGAATFLTRATTALAITFMLTSLTLTVIGGSRARRSALATQAQEEGVAAPFTPAGAPATTEGAQPTQGVMPGTAVDPNAGAAGAGAPPTDAGAGTQQVPPGGAGTGTQQAPPSGAGTTPAQEPVPVPPPGSN
jgi:preprotein translocase subunit SecG